MRDTVGWDAEVDGGWSDADLDSYLAQLEGGRADGFAPRPRRQRRRIFLVDNFFWLLPCAAAITWSQGLRLAGALTVAFEITLVCYRWVRAVGRHWFETRQYLNRAAVHLGLILAIFLLSLASPVLGVGLVAAIQLYGTAFLREHRWHQMQVARQFAVFESNASLRDARQQYEDPKARGWRRWL